MPHYASSCVSIFGRAFPSAMVEKVASHKAGLAYVVQEFECKLTFLGLAGGQAVERLGILSNNRLEEKFPFRFLF